jgi:hypothetical protein
MMIDSIFYSYKFIARFKIHFRKVYLYDVFLTTFGYRCECYFRHFSHLRLGILGMCNVSEPEFVSIIMCKMGEGACSDG